MYHIPIVENLSGEDFHREYVKPGKPVVIRRRTEGWRALQAWSGDYFKAIEGGLKLATKTGDVSQGKRESFYLSEYVSMLQEHEARLRNGEQPPRPPYLHDVPIFNLLPGLVKDIEPFPLDLFPKWYWKDWHNYIQFFMGATGSLTPLHFDTLCTQNLFFQVVGEKRFILIPGEYKDSCYIEGWRWARFDPSNPDYNKFPLAKSIEMAEVVIGPGDILYIPSGTLHQVHGLSYSISFNIDWHTARSARRGVMTMFRGAPRKNVYYNSLIFAGLNLKVPPRYIFPRYKTYLNYVS